MVLCHVEICNFENGTKEMGHVLFSSAEFLCDGTESVLFSVSLPHTVCNHTLECIPSDYQYCLIHGVCDILKTQVEAFYTHTHMKE